MPSSLHLAHWRMMAAYNRWANARLYAAAAAVAPEELSAPRGAFFGSILGTLNHLLVTDRIWMARLQRRPTLALQLDDILHDQLAALRSAREDEDAAIVVHVEALDDAALSGLLAYRNMRGDPFEQPLWQVLGHIFNHQTHHRGQTHDLLHQASGSAPPLDLLIYQRELLRG